MPTPVSIARQCLTEEAAHALDEAVCVARRRGHSQTSSLHAVSALLSLPSSALREACARARGGGPPYPTRLQFKALELCLSVSLDRVPAGQLGDDPPVSNSLMAAIKRSQAHQRRQPENFHLYHQLPNQSSMNNIIKVELKHLIISILDDPVVSRVFGEAGFRSSEIKMAILRPLPHLLRYTGRPRGPPMFLCNLNPDPDPIPGRVRFPFPAPQGFSHNGAGDGNCRRIGEVLVGSRNPLLVGACAHAALREFVQTLEKNSTAKPDHILPRELARFTILDIESNISEGSVDKKLDEAVSMLNSSQLSVEVLVVSFGDLKAFVDGESHNSEIDSVSRTVARLTSLLEAHRGKVRLIGFAASTDTYSNFVGKFPAVEKDWELQLLPITTLQPSSMAESSPRSSFMGSFVPFAGFFPSSSEYGNQVFTGSPYQYLPQCNVSTEKQGGRETTPITKSVSTTSLADKHQSSLPPWLQSPELYSNAKAKDRTRLDNGGQDNFQHIRQSPGIPISQTYRMDSRAETVTGSNLSVEEDRASPASMSTAATNLFPRMHSEPETPGRVLCDDYKTIYKALTEKLERQKEAVSLISETIASYKARNSGTRQGMSTRRDVWLTLLGPDRMAKWNIAVSLCETLYGSRENLIHIDLNPESDELDYRGRTHVDVIAEELRKRPLCVVFLENVDVADEQVQSSLLQAILTGKFSDSRGREIRVHQAIFVATVAGNRDLDGSSARFSEERVLKAKGWPMKIIVNRADDVLSASSTKNMNKRKLVGLEGNEASGEVFNNGNNNKRLNRSISSRNLDLNLPAENNEPPDSDDEDDSTEYDNDTISDISKAWLLDFIERTDAKITFKPYDFDSLAEKIRTEIRDRFHQTVGLKCEIEIESKVMEQLLCAIYRSEGNEKLFDDWVARSLRQEFAQVQRKYKLTECSKVSLVAYYDVSAEERLPENCLPCRVYID